MFFFIGLQEFFQLREEVPTKLRLASKMPAPNVFLNIAIPVTILTVVGSLISIGIVFVLSLRGSEYNEPVLAGLQFFGWFLASAVFFGVLAGWLESINMVRQELLSGKYREYFVSSVHASFSDMFTPAVRAKLVAEESYVAIVQEQLGSTAVIDADETLLEPAMDLEDYWLDAEARLAIIQAVEAFSTMASIDQNAHTALLRKDAHDFLEHEVKVSENFVGKSKMLLARLA